MRRAPGVRVIAPGVGAGLDADEPVVALGVRYAAAGASEVGIKGRVVLVDCVAVAAGGVALPHLDQSVGHRAAVLAEYAAFHDDALSLRLARVLPGEIGLLQGHVGMAVDRARDFGKSLRNYDQRLFRRSYARPDIVRRQIRGVGGVAGARVHVIHLVHTPDARDSGAAYIRAHDPT